MFFINFFLGFIEFLPFKTSKLVFASNSYNFSYCSLTYSSLRVLDHFRFNYYSFLPSLFKIYLNNLYDLFLSTFLFQPFFSCIPRCQNVWNLTFFSLLQFFKTPYFQPSMYTIVGFYFSKVYLIRS